MLVAIIRVGCDVVRRWRRGAPLATAAREAVRRGWMNILKALAAAAVQGGGMKTLKTTAAASAALAALCGASAAEAQDGPNEIDRGLQRIRGLRGEQEPVEQDLIAAHRRFACELHRVDGPDESLNLIATRDGAFDSAALPWGGRGISEHGTLRGNNERSPVLVMRRLFSGSGLTFIEAPWAGVSMLTINPERPAGAPAGTFTADYARHMFNVVSIFRGRCTAIG